MVQKIKWWPLNKILRFKALFIYYQSNLFYLLKQWKVHNKIAPGNLILPPTATYKKNLEFFYYFLPSFSDIVGLMLYLILCF